MSADDFQTRYASVMESMVRSAIAETTKLFENMVDDLKAEISKMKKENEDLKSRCIEFENAVNNPVNTRESELRPRLGDAANKRDTAVQCELVHHFQSQEQQSRYKEMEECLQNEQNHEIHEKGNSQVAYINVKQEEEDAPVGMCREVCGDIAGLPGPSASGIEPEGPFISRTYSKEELELLQKDEETTMALEVPCSAIDSGLSCLGVQSQTPEPEHQLVISLTAMKGTGEESLVSQQISETLAHSEIKTSEEQPLGIVQQQLVSELTEIEPTNLEYPVVISRPVINDGMGERSEVSPQILATWTQAEIKTSEQQPLVIVQQQLVDVPLQTRDETPDKTIPFTSKWSKEIVTSSSSIDKSSAQDAGNTPVREKNEIKSSTPPVSAAFRLRRHSSQKVKPPESQHLLMEVGEEAVQSSVQVPPAMETMKISVIESPVAPAIQPTSSTKILSIKEAAKMPVRELDKLNVISPSVSVVSLSTEPEIQQQSMGKNKDAIQSPSTEGLSATGMHNAPSTKLPQAGSSQPKERHTSHASLQDALLFVEAMNAQNLGYESTVKNASLQTQSASPLATLKLDAQVSAKPANSVASQASGSPITTKIAIIAAAKGPTLKQSTSSKPKVQTFSVGSQTTAVPPTTVAKAHKKTIVIPFNSATPVPSSTVVTQKITSFQQHFLNPHIKIVAPSKSLRNTSTPNIIVVPRHLSSVTPHTASPLSQTQVAAVVSTVAASQNSSSPPASNAVGLAMPSPSSVPLKIIGVTSKQSLPFVTSHTTTTSTSLHPKFTVVVPRQLSVGTSNQQLSSLAQKILLTTRQESAGTVPSIAVSLAQPVSFLQQSSISVDSQTVSGEKTVTLSQKRENISENSESQTASDTKKTNVLTEICLNSENLLSPELVQTSVSPAVPPAGQPELSPVVKLTRLPFSLTTKESVLVQKTQNGSTEALSIVKDSSNAKAISVTTHEKLLLVKSTQSSPARPISQACQLSEESNDIQACQLSQEPNNIACQHSLEPNDIQTCQLSEGPNDLQACQLSQEPNDIKEETVATTHSVSAVPERKSAPSEPPAAFLEKHSPVAEMSTACEPNSSLDLANNEVQDSVLPDNPLTTQEKLSDLPIRLTSIISEDTSDGHVQTSKSQFLAQLAVAVPPVVQVQQKAFSSDSVDSRAADADTTINERTTLQKDSLVARLRSHFKNCLQAERSKPKPETLTETEVPVRIKKPRLADCATDSPTEPVLTEDVASFKHKDSNSISPRRSRPCRSGVRADVSSVSPRRSSLRKELSSPKKTASESTSTSPSKSWLTKNGAGSKKTANAASSRRPALTKAGASPKKISESISVSCRRKSSTRNDAKAKIKCGASSPSAQSSSLANDGVSPKMTKESTPAMKRKLIQDGRNSKRALKVENAKELAKAEKLKSTTLRKSKQKLQSGTEKRQSRENNAKCETAKKCKSRAVWTPPRMSANKSSLTKERSLLSAAAKRERSLNTGQSSTSTNVSQAGKSKLASKGSQSSPCTVVFPPSVSLHPIPVRAPPIVSPLQPLSVIGRRLLKNQCGECGRVLSSTAALESHVSLHTGRRPFSCSLCGKGFPDSKGLKRHGRVHRNGRIHICPQCGKGFVYHFGLTKHLQMVHSRLKRFICQICNKGFLTKRDVEAHIRMHTGEKPFHCNLCEKKFARRVELNVHLRWHNGEKRHWCPYCGKGFLDFNNMKRHTYIHTGERPHACSHCPKNFKQSGHLKKHVRNVHKIQ